MSNYYKAIDKTRIEAHEKNYEYIKNNYPEYCELAYDRVIGANAFVAHQMVMSNNTNAVPKEDMKKIIRHLQTNIMRIINSKYFSNKRKATITILIINPNLYRVIMKMIYRYEWDSAFGEIN